MLEIELAFHHDRFRPLDKLRQRKVIMQIGVELVAYDMGSDLSMIGLPTSLARVGLQYFDVKLQDTAVNDG